MLEARDMTDWVKRILTEGKVVKQNKRLDLYVMYFMTNSYCIHNGEIKETSFAQSICIREYNRIRKSLINIG